METLIDQWLFYVRHMYAHKPKTIRIYKSIGNMFAKEWQGKASITTDDVEAFIMKEINRGVTNPTINQKLAILKVFLNWAIDHNKLSDKPKIKLLRVPKMRVVKSFDNNEVAKILELSKGNIIEVAVWLCLMAGLRREEIRFLEWKDIDLNKRVIYIRAKKGFSPKALNERTIPISEKLAEKLRRRFKPTWVINVGWNQVGIGLMERNFRQILESAGLYEPGMATWHRLRHTFASRFIEAGGDIQNLKDIMGHCSISTTQTYMHSNPIRQRAIIEEISL